MKVMTKMKKIYNPVIQETIYHHVLENGLPVYFMPKKGFTQKYAIFATNYGSIDNKFRIHGNGELITVPDGIAHFLEHKMFETKEGNTFDQFAAIGANVNAFTTYSTTSYLFDTIDNFSESLQLLLDFVQDLYVTEESIEREKDIIQQEIVMYEDDPDWICYLNILQALFHHHPVRVDIAGTVESIREINKETLFKCFETFYHPSNMVLFILGDLNPVEVLELVEQNQEKKKYTWQPPIERQHPEEPLTVVTKRVEGYMPVSRPIYNLGFKDRSLYLQGDTMLKQDLVTNILLEIMLGKGSELYQELYASGLIDDSFAVSYTLESDHGYTVLGGHTNDPDQLHEALVRGIQAKKGKIELSELERVRKRMIGDYIVAFDSMKATAQNFVAYFFKNMDLFHELDLMNTITLEDLENRLEDHFHLDYHAVSIIYPSAQESCKS